ncbi:hypothetical protein L209DRAFT_767081 [Thermothelomyces heterothallicus CBS 203.75]
MGANGPTLDNSCDPETLTYGCVCSDGKQPNVSEYTLTLPYYVCMTWVEQCVDGCGNDNQCQSDCQEKHPCGAQSPKRANTTQTSSSTTASATATPTDQVFDGLGDGSDNSDSSNKGNAAGALRLGDSYGVALLAGSLFAGFALVL